MDKIAKNPHNTSGPTSETNPFPTPATKEDDLNEDKTVCYDDHNDSHRINMRACCHPCPNCGANIKIGAERQHRDSQFCITANPIKVYRLGSKTPIIINSS